VIILEEKYAKIVNNPTVNDPKLYRLIAERYYKYPRHVSIDGLVEARGCPSIVEDRDR
jgi:hypothetical protein